MQGRRQRSRHVTTLLVGTALAGALTACQEEPQERFYASFAECTRDNPEQECRTAEEQATARHREQAPRFATREACEEQMGPDNCQEVPADPTPGAGPNLQSPGGGWFMPALMGYMIGRSLGGPSYLPVYVDRDGYSYAGGRRWGTLSRRDHAAWRAGGWRPGYRSAGQPPASVSPRVDVRPPASFGAQTAPRSGAGPSVGTPSVPRGGFGSTGRSFGGGS
ncbi:MAG TPA: DUF1190 domain-containing protein [Azospirillaceae bacterium]|nr:DUF1190 domain-containing protein [Azospirillaceae bacterium]